MTNSRCNPKAKAFDSRKSYMIALEMIQILEDTLCYTNSGKQLLLIVKLIHESF